MYKLFSFTIIILILKCTIGIALFEPDMHNRVIVYDSAYTIVQPEKPETETKNIPTVSTEQAVKKIPETVTQQTVKPVTKQYTQQTDTQKTQTRKVVSNTTNTKKKTVSQKVTTVKTETKKVSVPEKTSTVQKTAQPKTTVQKQTTTVQKAPVQQVQQTAEQIELIKWNKWRSDIQNQLMTDVRLPILPQGTVFKFKFDVDRYGKVTNIQTWSTNPNFTPFAIQYIAPVIRSYQGRSILNFPDGSNRISTTVEGGWKISSTTKFSTPADFKDVEKVSN